MTPRLSARDEQHLSDYLDGKISPQVAAAFEKRLKSDPILADVEKDLRRMKVVLRSAPRFRASRNFTLTPAMVQIQSSPLRGFWLPLMRFSSAVAALILAAIFVLESLPMNLRSLPANAIEPAAQMLEESAPEPDMSVSPSPIIIWNDPAEGLGGSGGGPAGQDSQAAEKTGETMLEPAAEAEAMMEPPAPLATPGPEAALPFAAPETGSSAAPEAFPAEPFSTVPQPPDEKRAAEDAQPAFGQEGGSVPNIMGLQPTGESPAVAVPEGMAKAPPPAQLAPEQIHPREENPLWLWIKIILALTALSTGMAAVLLQGKTRK